MGVRVCSSRGRRSPAATAAGPRAGAPVPSGHAPAGRTSRRAAAAPTRHRGPGRTPGTPRRPVQRQRLRPRLRDSVHVSPSAGVAGRGRCRRRPRPGPARPRRAYGPASPGQQSVERLAEGLGDQPFRTVTGAPRTPPAPWPARPRPRPTTAGPTTGCCTGGMPGAPGARRPSATERTGIIGDAVDLPGIQPHRLPERAVVDARRDRPPAPATRHVGPVPADQSAAVATGSLRDEHGPADVTRRDHHRTPRAGRERIHRRVPPEGFRLVRVHLGPRPPRRSEKSVFIGTFRAATAERLGRTSGRRVPGATAGPDRHTAAQPAHAKMPLHPPEFAPATVGQQ